MGLSAYTHLQIFPSKIVYNEETRYFETVLPNSGCEVAERIGWRGDVSDVFSTTSMSTMFLTDDCIGDVSSLQVVHVAVNIGAIAIT